MAIDVVEDEEGTEDSVTVTPEEEYIKAADEFVEELVNKLDLKPPVEEAAKEAVEDVPLRIRQHYDPCYMAAAAIHLETRKSRESCPRTVKQVANNLDHILENQTHLSNYSNHLSRTRRTAKKLKQCQELDLKPELAGDYLPYLLDSFDLGEETRDQARNILEEISGSQELQSKSQIGIASAITYLAAKETGEEVSVKDLAELACRNRKTIRESARMIENTLLGDDT